MTSKIKPLADRVLIKVSEAETTTQSGIIIPDNAQEKPQKGIVVAIGNGKKDEPLTVKIGDTVLYSKYGGTELKLDYNWPKKVLLRPEPVVLEFYTYDGGATIWGRYLYRSYTPETHPYANAEGDELVIFNVTIKDGGAGNQEIFFLDDQPVNETPELYFTPGSRYRFILEHVSNASAPLRFSTAPDTIVSDGDTNTIVPYTEGVVIDGVAGDPNAYVEIEITETTPLPLYLYAEEQPNGLDTSKIGMELAITANPSYVRIKIANKLQDADEDTYIIAETDWEVDNDDLDFYIAGVHRMQLNDKCLRILDGTKLCVEDTRDDALDVKGGARISGDLVVGGDIIYSPDLSLSVIDTWKNLKINGVNISNQTNEFVVNDLSELYQIGSTTNDPSLYGFDFFGIKQDEKILGPDVRKVNVIIKKAYTTNEVLNKVNAYYRVYVREGKTEVQVQDWTQLNRTPDSHYFIFNTEDKIPNEYFIDIKVLTDREINTYKRELKFQIVNRK